MYIENNLYFSLRIWYFLYNRFKQVWFKTLLCGKLFPHGFYYKNFLLVESPVYKKHHILKFRYSSLWMNFVPNVIFVWFCNCDFLLSLKMNASLPGLCFSAWVVSEQKLWKGVRISSLSWPLIGQIISLISLIGLISYSDDPWWWVDIFVFTQHTSSH